MNAPLRESALDVINSGEIELERLARMGAAFDAMTKAFGKFDGSFEAASAQFKAIKEGSFA